ncbi:hypothetical protein NQ317_018439 [Molorchus minor]|uniref:TGF-beta family profile domain-containing protein n=1 Tax=Molorchus minor TaxID=1323400 RepID=A0ABQ9JE65_9CUCU|nr:hypothetical protein NQ317_018439 [Molorchus minor]
MACASPAISIQNQSQDFSQNDYLLDTEWDFNHTNVTRRELPLFIHKLYETHASLFPKTTTRILFNTNNNGSSRIMKFNLNSLKPNKEQVLEADLYFFWPLDSNSTIYRESVVMRLYQFEKQKDAAAGDSAAENPDIHKVFNVIYISKAQRGWQTFKIKKPIDNWLNGEENLGLLLTISSYDDNKLITIFNDTNNGIYSTFAIITVQNNDTVSSFNTVEYKTHGTPTNCQRTEWNVNFQYKNWNKFIISPDGFRAYDCSGKCLGTEEDHENHLKLLYTYHRRPPCCVPVEYSPLPIMFYDKYGNVIIKNYQNMIVTKCGCR